jgi:muramidase (phage lysozyme)
MATPKTITAFKYRTEVIADITKHTSEFKKADANVDKFAKTNIEAAKKSESAWSSFFKGLSKGQEQFSGSRFGEKFGKEFGANAVAAIGNTFSVSTLGGLMGTALFPGAGTAIGSAIGSGIDKAISTVAPIVMQQISGGIELNKVLEETALEYKTFVGSEKEANKYLQELLGISKDIGILPTTVIDASEKLIDLTGNLKLTRTVLKAAADQAADFGGSIEVFQTVADTLGLIAERGEIAQRELQKLYRSGIDAKKYLSEATGLSQEKIVKLIGQGRIRGDVAARLIAEGIEREKGGFAAARTGSTVAGRERQFNVLMALRAQEGTQNITRGLGDFYEKADAILNSPQAKKVVDFIDHYAGVLVNFTEGALKTGVSIGGGVAEGLLNFSPATMVQSFTKLGDFVETGLKSVFEIKSPSERSAREIGEPIGEGIGLGVVRGLRGFIQGQGGEDIAATIRELLKDPRVQALLDTIAKAEGGGINVMAGGRRVNSGAQHPGQIVPRSQWFKGNRGPSSASGLYQETLTNWLKAESVFGPLNFSNPEDQKLVALWLMVNHQGGLQTLKSGNADQMMALTAKDWTSTPGSTIGGGGQRSKQQWLGYYNQALSVGGKGIDASNPLPVYFVGVTGGAGAYVPGSGRARDLIGGAANIFNPAARQQKQTQDLKDYTLVLGQADGAVVDLKVNMDELVHGAIEPGSRQFREFINSVQPAYRALVPLIGAEKEHAATSIALTKEYQQAARDELIKGISVLDQLSGALSQIPGMMPQQTVGKKRGLFSKILGVAAPFLSFLPGGGILSMLAGMGSNALAGNWGGVVSGLATGLQPGGVFRSSGAGGAGSTGNTGSGASTGNQGSGLVPRASGGPGIRGHRYWVGEHGPEPFIAPANGYFLNHRDAMRSMSGGGGGDAGMAGAIERLNSFLARLEGMKAHDVVRIGARGYIDAMGSDAELTRLHGQRLRLA